MHLLPTMNPWPTPYVVAKLRCLERWLSETN